jgi:hypothetical protein
MCFFTTLAIYRCVQCSLKIQLALFSLWQRKETAKGFASANQGLIVLSGR